MKSSVGRPVGRWTTRSDSFTMENAAPAETGAALKLSIRLEAKADAGTGTQEPPFRISASGRQPWRYV